MENASNLIGISGIIVSFIVGMLTCLVTWFVTKKGQETKKLSYNISTHSFLASPLVLQGKFSELTITYYDKKLEEPCLLSVIITNTGN